MHYNEYMRMNIPTLTVAWLNDSRGGPSDVGMETFAVVKCKVLVAAITCSLCVHSFHAKHAVC